jgi:type I restriction-modification system DNA methylase subunit/transcriptional regulator with XRE-family HTH domain
MNTKNIKINLKKAREQHGFTQRQLAERSGVSYSTITKLEAGFIENPTIEHLIKMASVLDVTVNSLISDNSNIGKFESLVTISDSAHLLGVSDATVRNWIKLGHLKPAKDSYIDIADLTLVKESLENGTLGKLNSRANKKNSKKSFIPKEYSYQEESIVPIIRYVKENGFSVDSAMFLLSLNFLKEAGVALNNQNREYVLEKRFDFTSSQAREVVLEWANSIKKEVLTDKDFVLIDIVMPNEQDVLGMLYQSLLEEGSKIKLGSYYTPLNIVENIAQDYCGESFRVLDPCCGTGQFLKVFGKHVGESGQVCGFEIDPLAKRIAQINMVKDNLDAKIILQDALERHITEPLLAPPIEKDAYDLVATNPPWGYRFDKKQKRALSKAYPEIRSTESFSYFLVRSLELVKQGGVVSFILPVSILNVKAHSDIRKLLLSNSEIIKISHLGKPFTNVTTDVIRIDLKKQFPSVDHKIQIETPNNTFNIKQARFTKNKDNIFNIHVEDYAQEILDHVFNRPYKTLQESAEWALGIVTGDNKKHLLDTPTEKSEPIYRGRDVNYFLLDSPSSFIELNIKGYQQVAPLEKYRAKEKLIYKFISSKLVFAYDNKKSLTLNSANIIIPSGDYPIKVIVALFNSTLYQYLFKCMFNSVKVLRDHLENLPLPTWKRETLLRLEGLVDEIIKTKDSNIREQIDSVIYREFDLDKDQISYIKKFMKGK